MQPLISVIVPVYKVEKYLAACIESVLAQEYTNLEIILVDDGSPDKCPKICDEYSAKDSRITVIHKENGGQGSARNVGIDASHGEYIVFVDSDDLIHASMISTLYGIIEKYNVDMVLCNIKNIYEGETVNLYEDIHIGTVKVKSSTEAVKDLFGRKRVLAVSPCNKIYKRKLFENLYFPVGKIHEDEFTTFRLFFKCNKVASIRTNLYYYTQRSGSTMHSKTIHADYDIEAISDFSSFCEHNLTDTAVKDELLALSMRQKGDILLDAYYSATNQNMKSEAERYSALYRELSPKLSETGMKKLKFRLFEFSPALFILAFRINIILHKRELNHFK